MPVAKDIVDQAHPSPSASASEQRQWNRLMQMARLGAIPGDGVNRACLTLLDREARRLLRAWAAEAGAVISVDEAANLWLRHEGTDPGVSHNPAEYASPEALAAGTRVLARALTRLAA